MAWRVEVTLAKLCNREVAFPRLQSDVLSLKSSILSIPPPCFLGALQKRKKAGGVGGQKLKKMRLQYSLWVFNEMLGMCDVLEARWKRLSFCLYSAFVFEVLGKKINPMGSLAS